MKKQHIIAISTIVSIVAMVAITLFLLLRPTVREWTGEDGAHNSVTTRGMFGITEHDNNNVIAFADFTTGQESVFCSRPQCRHNSSDCFAFDLANTYHARHFAIMGEYIYFTSASYNPTRETRHAIDIFEANFTGGTLRSIARIENRESISVLDSNMVEGYFILGIAVGGSSSTDKEYYAIIDLRTGDLWQMPVFGNGYNNNTNFHGMSGGNLLFAHTYATRSFSTDDFAEMVAQDGHWQAMLYVSNYNRTEIYLADFAQRSFTICETYTQEATVYSGRIETRRVFPASGGKVVSITIQRENGFEYSNVFLSIDKETGEITHETVLPFDFMKFYGDFLFDFVDDDPAVFCTNTRTYKVIGELNDFNHIFSIRLNSNIIFFTDRRTFGTDIISTSFIEIADLFETGIETMESITHSPFWTLAN